MAETTLVSPIVVGDVHLPIEVGDQKQLRIRPREILESLGRWRIATERIVFSITGEGDCKAGASADVQLASLHPLPSRPGNMEHVAVKKFRLQDESSVDRALAPFAHEVSLLSQLSHSNIAQLKGFSEDFEAGIAWAVLPWEANGNLREFLHSAEYEIPERVSLILDVSNGISYLHNRNPPICHGDLKSLNVLVNSYYRAIITDFGSARAIEDTNALQANKPTSDGQPPKPDLSPAPESPKIELGDCGASITVTGPAWTLRWAAPELLNAEAPDLASDVWAFAWICWEVMTGNFPFYGENESAVIGRLANGNLPTVGDNQQLSQLQALCSLMTDCWLLDPDRRPTISFCTEYIRRWMDWAIPSPRTPEALPDNQSVELLLALGRVDLSNGKINEAIRRFQRSVDIARSTMQDWKRSCAAYDLAHAYVLSSDYPKAEASYIEAREAINGTYRWDKHQLGHILSGLGDVYSLSGKIAKAEASYIEAREAFAAIGEQECSGHNTIQLGMLYRRTNECDKAEALCKEARDMYVRIQSVRGVPHATLALGHVYLRRGDYREAQASYTEAYDVFTRTGDNPCLISSAMGLGHVYRLCEEYDKAEAMYNKAHTPLVRLRNKRFIGIVLLGLAEIREKQQRFTEAEQYLGDATAIFSELGWEDDLTECDAQIKSLHKRIRSLTEESKVRGP